MRTCWIGLTAAFLVCVGCAPSLQGSADRQEPAPDSAQVPYAAKQMSWPTGSAVNIARNVEELLPNVRLDLRQQGRGATNSSSVVRGTVVSIEPGLAQVWPMSKEGGDDREPQAERVAFDDPSAQSRSWEVRVRVSSTIAGAEPSTLLDLDEPAVVPVRLTSNGGEVDVKRFESAVMGLGDSVWFLTLWRGYEGTFLPGWLGHAIASVGADGVLSFPFVPDDERKLMVPRPYSVEDLVNLGKEPERTVTE